MNEWVWSNGGMILTGKTGVLEEKHGPSTTLYTTNPNWTYLAPNPGLCSQRTGTNRLSYGMAPDVVLWIITWQVNLKTGAELSSELSRFVYHTTRCHVQLIILDPVRATRVQLEHQSQFAETAKPPMITQLLSFLPFACHGTAAV
jgi:hypothetical protein